MGDFFTSISDKYNIVKALKYFKASDHNLTNIRAKSIYYAIFVLVHQNTISMTQNCISLYVLYNYIISFGGVVNCYIFLAVLKVYMAEFIDVVKGG